MKNHKKLFFVRVLFILLLIFNPHIFANTEINQLQNLANEYVEKYSTTDASKQGEGISGIQLTVLQNGKMKTFVAGTIGHDTKSPVTPENLFSWGSITKEFTTAIILQLQEQGKLNLNQTLQYWFPENFFTEKGKQSIWPMQWSKIKVFELLNMTSGIPNAINNSTSGTGKLWNKKTLFETNWQPNRLVEIAAEYTRSGNCKKQCFAAGTHWSYSNTNYVIASMIAEKAKKEAFGKQMQDLLKNADITAYYVPNERPGKYLDKMMHGYFYYPVGIPAAAKIKGVSDGFDTSNTLQWSTSPASGALIGSTQNITKSVFKLFNDEILSKNSTAILKNDYFANQKNGELIKNLALCPDVSASNKACYGLGVQAMHSKSLGTVYQYSGQILGFRSVYYWVPKENILIAITVNSTAGYNHIMQFAFHIFNVVTKK